MSDIRDEAFRKLLEAVRSFNRRPTLERRDLVRLAAGKLTWAHKVMEDTPPDPRYYE